MFKRLFDIVGALVALCIAAPVLLPIAIWILLDSRGPVLYRARRIGRHNHPFVMYKFRTMVADAERRGPALTYQADPRITRAGRLLRRTHLDELPQLFNVLKGDMSLVGPRPEAPDYVDAGSPIWQQVLSVRPGICGLSQLVFATAESAILSSGARVDQDYTQQVLPRKLALDLRYIKRQSLPLDIILIFQTILLVLRQHG
jgi:lipopolysaccharide/colanic/teichoic acid biosynthesis glycosyltransferase